MADVWDHLLLLLLTHQTAHVYSLDICSPTVSCAHGYYCCRAAPNGCCPEAERTEATAWTVVGVMAMLAAGGYGFWRYKVAQRMIRWRRDADRPPLPAASGGRALPPASVRALPAPPGWTPGSAFAAETPPHSPDTASPSETAPLLS
ncbi:uncharacterized protein LOC126088114 [Schistocerca cancellata]|uniref:uncharacterized protein LOC126088114 n=1 Tax=Schistocerca cancellata TaxID=274614 RepID=UPI002118BE52|nr:uncharacterized protein LOC126088114 [Schistocerca cancellata]